jgi:HD-GYP domain-containing protein (c-di-GMP phosphodiesterase class II)
MAGLLHDIGENSLDDAVINKVEKNLTPAERQQWRQHPEWGSEILKKLTAVPPEVIAVALEHHEDEKGGGFPSGLDGSRIHAMAKVVAVADKFCELVLDGPKSGHMSPAAAQKSIADSKIYNADVVDALKRLLKGMAA